MFREFSNPGHIDLNAYIPLAGEQNRESKVNYKVH